MTLVAAIALHDRVLVLADVRLTAIYPRGKETYYDHTLKLFPCGPLTVVGFAGDDVPAAAIIVRDLLAQAQQRAGASSVQYRGRSLTPSHPSRLHAWIPRYLRHAYAKRATRAPLAFLVASAVPDVESIVTRKALYQLLLANAERGSAPAWLFEAFRAATEAGWDGVVLAGTWAPRILVMESPLFVPHGGRAFSLAAIGSGRSATLNAVDADPSARRLLFTPEPGFEAAWFDIVAGEASSRAGIKTVGGLRPIYEISKVQGCVRARPSKGTRTTPSGQEDVELVPLADGHWMQRNLTTGEEITALFPWEAIRNLPRGGMIF